MLSLYQVGRVFETPQGPLTALANVTLELPDNAIIGLLGPNGSGKTTLMRIIMGILPPTTGTVHLNGQPLSSIDRRQVGYMPEERGLYPKEPLTRQLKYLLKLRGFSAQEVKNILDTWSERLAIKSYIDRPAKALSKGMQQKAQLLLALAGEPSFLLLDEPFSGLDPLNAKEIEEILHSLRAPGRLILLSTHRLEQVDHLCDYVVLIHKGHILLNGYTDALRRQFWDEQYFLETGQPLHAIRWPQEVQYTPLSDHAAELQLLEGYSSQAFLQAILSQTAIRTFYEKLPPIRDIFLKKVREYEPDRDYLPA